MSTLIHRALRVLSGVFLIALGILFVGLVLFPIFDRWDEVVSFVRLFPDPTTFAAKASNGATLMGLVLLITFSVICALFTTFLGIERILGKYWTKNAAVDVDYFLLVVWSSGLTIIFIVISLAIQTV